MNIDDQLVVFYLAFNDCCKEVRIFYSLTIDSLVSHGRATSHYVCPGALAFRFVIAVMMLMGGNHYLTSGLGQKRSPKVCTGALPYGIIVCVSRVFIGGMNISGIGFRIGVEDRLLYTSDAVED